jgi:hypothetical protein
MEQFAFQTVKGNAGALFYAAPINAPPSQLHPGWTTLKPMQTGQIL